MRNPDITLPDDIPDGLCVIEGKQLMITARNKQIPFGVAKRKTPANGHRFRMETVGIVVRLEDKDRMLAAIKAKESARKHRKIL